MQKMPINNGGRPEKQEIPYSQPQGPKDQFHEGPGYGDRPGGQNLGTSGTQGRH